MSLTEDDIEINTHKSRKMPMGVWCHRSVISAHGMWKQKDQDFKARLGCIAGSRPEGDTGEALPESVSPAATLLLFSAHRERSGGSGFKGLSRINLGLTELT